MHQVIVYLLLLLSALGIIGIYRLVRLIIRYKRTEQRPKSNVRFISVLLLVIIMTFGGLYWLIDCYFIERPPHSFTIEKALEKYEKIGGFNSYKILDQIDPEFTTDKILLVQENDDILIVCYITTRKMLVGLEKFYIYGGAEHINIKISGNKLISEKHANGGGILYFPDLWYGIIYPENRDKIRINGKVPHFHDIHFNGSDYVLWYTEKDAEKAELFLG